MNTTTATMMTPAAPAPKMIRFVSMGGGIVPPSVVVVSGGVEVVTGGVDEAGVISIVSLTTMLSNLA